MCGDICLHDKRRDLVAIGQHNNVVASSLESPKILLFGVLDVEILQIDWFPVWKRVKDSLEQAPVLIAMDPVFEDSGFYFSELETGIRMEGEPVPVLSVDHQIANEKAFSRASEIQHADDFIDLGSNFRVNRT
jgi:hypothetical protein